MGGAGKLITFSPSSLIHGPSAGRGGEGRDWVEEEKRRGRTGKERN